MAKIVFLTGVEDNIVVIRYDSTTNGKIIDSPKEKIVQTYTFSMAQWELANNGAKITPDEFFKLDLTNCGDCPFSGNENQKAGECYTHKYMQYAGFLSMLRSISYTDLFPSEDKAASLSSAKVSTIKDWCKGAFVRFGSYGEPSVLPVFLVEQMVSVARTWTGYTHQWMKADKQDYSSWFMASVHGKYGQLAAEKRGWLAYIASNTGTEQAVQCPASKEAGYKSNCAKCGLCSGTTGKGNKSVKILNHA